MNNPPEGLTYDGDYRDMPVVSNVQLEPFFLISLILLLVSNQMVYYTMLMTD